MFADIALQFQILFSQPYYDGNKRESLHTFRKRKLHHYQHRINQQNFKVKILYKTMCKRNLLFVNLKWCILLHRLQKKYLFFVIKFYYNGSYKYLFRILEFYFYFLCIQSFQWKNIIMCLEILSLNLLYGAVL